MASWTKRELSKLKNDPHDTPYDDIQVALSSARVPASSAPTWRTHDFGVGGGIAFSVLGFAVGDYIDFYIQTSHTQVLNSVLDNHVHGTLPSDSAGDKIKWQLDVIAAGIGDAFTVPEGSPYTHEFTLTGNEAGRHNLLDIADIPAMNTTVSSIYICRLTRIASAAPQYSPEVYLIYNDSHYFKDSDGSYFEGAKLTEEMAAQKGTPSKPFKPGAW